MTRVRPEADVVVGGGGVGGDIEGEPCALGTEDAFAPERLRLTRA